MLVYKHSFKLTGPFDEESDARISLIFVWKNTAEKEQWFADFKQVLTSRQQNNQVGVGWVISMAEKDGLQQLFSTLDSNHDGFLSIEETFEQFKDYNFKPEIFNKIWFLLSFFFID